MYTGCHSCPLYTPESIYLIPGTAVHWDFTLNAGGYPRAGVTHLSDNRQTMLPGDLNGDQIINSSDYVLWYNAQTPPGAEPGYFPADVNGDGYVDGEDYEWWHKAARGETLFNLSSPQ